MKKKTLNYNFEVAIYLKFIVMQCIRTVYLIYNGKEIMELDKQQMAGDSPEFSIEPYVSLNERQETISGECFPEHSIVMCERCYWCCTCFNDRGLLTSCPLCFHGTSKIPLTIEENCKICYDKIRGFTMKFYRKLPLR